MDGWMDGGLSIAQHCIRMKYGSLETSIIMTILVFPCCFQATSEHHHLGGIPSFYGVTDFYHQGWPFILSVLVSAGLSPASPSLLRSLGTENLVAWTNAKGIERKEKLLLRKVEEVTMRSMF